MISIDFITAVIQQFLTSDHLQSFGQRKRKLTELEAHGLDQPDETVVAKEEFEQVDIYPTNSRQGENM